MVRGAEGRLNTENYHPHYRILGAMLCSTRSNGRAADPCVEEIPSKRQRYKTHMRLLQQLRS